MLVQLVVLLPDMQKNSLGLFSQLAMYLDTGTNEKIHDT